MWIFIIEVFLEKETIKWRCPQYGEVICCHNGLCFNCSLDKLRQNKNNGGTNQDWQLYCVVMSKTTCESMQPVRYEINAGFTLRMNHNRYENQSNAR